MDGFSKLIVKLRIPILIFAIISAGLGAVGMINTKINYDMLSYLPSEIETMKGQDILMDEFGKGAFSLVVVENMSNKDVAALNEKIRKIDGVADVLWWDSIADVSVPMEFLPDDAYNMFNSGDTTMLAVFFDEATSSDLTLDAFNQIRSLAKDQCYVSGMTAMVEDLKELCESEEIIYVIIAVVLSTIVMLLFLDSWALPFIFLTSIGIAILWNMGTNIVLGSISFITMALAAVLQLAVTMDYSIFLWHSYKEQKQTYSDKNEAMVHAISQTLVSVVGSSTTTVAGFIALCFMSYRLGMDLGIVMAKGVILGVIGAVTTLPALILTFDSLIMKLEHRNLMPDVSSIASWIVDHAKIFRVLFIILLIPALWGYNHYKVYYNIGASLPDYMAYTQAAKEVADNYDMNQVMMILADADLSHKDAKGMLDEINKLDGISMTLGVDSLTGTVPSEFLGTDLVSDLKNDKYQLMLVGSEYDTATDEIDAQIDDVKAIVAKYDKSAMVIGEGPATKDLIEITDSDFNKVNIVSIAFTFIIIILVLRSAILPVLLIAVIELAIFINLGIPGYTGSVMAFITPICISTIQLGACVDYAILTTTRYKQERMQGKGKKEAIKIALSVAMPSIIVSALGFFAATLGVGIYSDVDMISSICILMARGAIISLLSVIFILPSVLQLFDGLICKTTLGMTKIGKEA